MEPNPFLFYINTRSLFHVNCALGGWHVQRTHGLSGIQRLALGSTEIAQMRKIVESNAQTMPARTTILCHVHRQK